MLFFTSDHEILKDLVKIFIYQGLAGFFLILAGKFLDKKSIILILVLNYLNQDDTFYLLRVLEGFV